MAQAKEGERGPMAVLRMTIEGEWVALRAGGQMSDPTSFLSYVGSFSSSSYVSCSPIILLRLGTRMGCSVALMAP